MIGMHGIGQLGGGAQAGAQVVAHRLVIDAPALVFAAGAGAETPPAIRNGIGVQMPESVGEAAFKPAAHPFALFGQEAG